MQTKRFFQLEVIIIILVSSFWFIWIPMVGLLFFFFFYFQYWPNFNIEDGGQACVWVMTIFLSSTVYGHYKYVYSYSAGLDFTRQNLTSEDVRFWRLKSIPAL